MQFIIANFQFQFATGIGYEIVKQFYNDGAVVFVLDKEQALLDKVKSEMPTVTTICVDLLNWEAAFDAVKKLAPLDHLVNNAGVIKDEILLDVTSQSFDLLVSFFRNYLTFCHFNCKYLISNSLLFLEEHLA